MTHRNIQILPLASYDNIATRLNVINLNWNVSATLSLSSHSLQQSSGLLF
jgi:hypothetical protein